MKRRAVMLATELQHERRQVAWYGANPDREYPTSSTTNHPARYCEWCHQPATTQVSH